MRKIIYGVLLCLIALPAFSASFDPGIKWRTIKTEHFEVHFADSLEAAAQKSALYLEEAHQKLSPKLKWKPWGRTQVILTDSNDSANGMASTLPYNWLNLRVSAPDPDNSLAANDNWLRTLSMHEYTHILHIDQTGGVMKVPRLLFGKIIAPNGTVPGWMREGIATYDETAETTYGRGRSSYAEMLIRTAIITDKFPSIDKADGLGWTWPTYQSMYIYGVKFLQYIADTYGEDKLMEFQTEMGRTPFLYGINHVARRVFTDIKWESVKSHTHYSRVRTPGTPHSKTFYDLWDEWKASLEKKYAVEKAEFKLRGGAEMEDVAAGGTVLGSPAVSPDGKLLAYARSRMKGPAELHLLDIATGIDKVIKRKQHATHINFSPDGKTIAYSAMGSWKRYNSYSDIYLYTLETKKSKQLTKGQRASDPAFSPDGKKIVFVKQNAGTGWLAVYDVESKETKDLVTKDGDTFTQFAQPAWSPDGKRIAVVSWQNPPEGGFWDIYTYDAANGKRLSQLTDDQAIDSHPVWSSDSKAIYFASDRSGINNIYKMDSPANTARRAQHFRGNDVRITNHDSQITNVLTGAFQPAISPDEKTLYVQYYNGEGFEIKKTNVIEGKIHPPLNPLPSREGKISNPPPLEKGGEGGFTSSEYSPFGKSLFLPRFVVPNVATLDNAVVLGAFTGSADPVRRHNWTGGVNYRTDLTSYVGYFFSYWYNRYRPVFSTGITEYPVNFGAIRFVRTDGTRHDVNLYEGRRRIYGGLSVPWKKNNFGLQYFWENRRPEAQISAAEANSLNLGNFAGFSASYSYGHVERYPASISYEHGRKLRTNFTITDSLLGSREKNEQRIFAGDYREYISLPWSNHVLALRTSGGITFGDALVQGVFSMGGALGEGMMGGGDSLYYFPLRGMPIAGLAGTRSLSFSGEYRIPVFSPQRGLGTTPFYLQNVHFAPFADYGNTWVANTDMWGNGKHFFDNFLLGTGVELRGDFIIGHGLPVTGRLGYAIIVVNRDRINTIKDPLLKTPVKNGMMVLQLGTAF